jgi:hypothetical protein
MTGDDLKRMQDHFLEGAKTLLLEQGRLQMVGFVITLHKHVDKLFESGWGIEFLDPKECLRDAKDDNIAALIVNLSMNWKRLYHAVLNVYPQTRDVLPQLLALGRTVDVDDPYMRVMRPFLAHTQLDEKDVVAATMRQICDKVEAFACIFQSEAWQRTGTFSEREEIPDSLEDDAKSIEVVISSMETHDFARMLTVPVHRKPAPKAKKRDAGKIVGFGELLECVDSLDGKNILNGRLVRFLKPLAVAS